MSNMSFLILKLVLTGSLKKHNATPVINWHFISYLCLVLLSYFDQKTYFYLENLIMIDASS